MTTSTLTPRMQFRETVAAVAEQARAILPEAVNGRIESAVKLVLQGDVLFCDDGSVEVGSSDPTRYYRLVGPTCTCTDYTSGKAPEGWCKHRTAAGILKRTNEVLAKASSSAPEPVAEADGWPPEEAILEEPPSPEAEEVPPPALPMLRTPGTIAPLTAQALEASLAEWSAQRKVITRYIREHFTKGVDYYVLTIKDKETKPSLGKAGAEKFLALFHLQASFQQDTETWEMLGRPAGMLCYRCTLTTRSGEVVGEGRGCREVKKDGGDVNKAIKMAAKSAQIDAVLRTGALSDVFTQDLEDLPRESQTARAQEPIGGDGQALLQLKREIQRTLATLGFAGGTDAAYKAEVKRRTGLDLVPQYFQTILDTLRAAKTAA